MSLLSPLLFYVELLVTDGRIDLYEVHVSVRRLHAAERHTGSRICRIRVIFCVQNAAAHSAYQALIHLFLRGLP